MISLSEVKSRYDSNGAVLQYLSNCSLFGDRAFTATRLKRRKETELYHEIFSRFHKIYPIQEKITPDWIVSILQTEKRIECEYKQTPTSPSLKELNFLIHELEYQNSYDLLMRLANKLDRYSTYCSNQCPNLHSELLMYAAKVEDIANYLLQKYGQKFELGINKRKVPFCCWYFLNNNDIPALATVLNSDLHEMFKDIDDFINDQKHF